MAQRNTRERFRSGRTLTVDPRIRRIGYAAFDPPLRHLPLAPFSSLRGERCARAWAAWLMVWLTPLSMLALVSLYILGAF